MRFSNSFSPGLSRRSFITGSAAVGAGIALGSMSAAARADSGRAGAVISGQAASNVDPAQFVPSSQLQQWQNIANDAGLRATGSDAHHQYIDGLVERMKGVGITDIVYEDVEFERWVPSRWSLDIVNGVDSESVHVAWYVPYSGSTSSDGVTAALSLEPAPGIIGLVTVEAPSLPYALFDVVDYDTPLQPAHPAGYNPLDTYDRPWLGQGAIAEAMDRFQTAGAVGLVVVWDVPREVADGQYAPYDGIVRSIPSLSVDRETGAKLQQHAEAKGLVRLSLEATSGPATSPNVYGVVHGRTDEYVMVQSHTDGTNGLEENGCEGILAIAQYLSRVPRVELPRSILFVMSTGHMAGHALGTEAFLTRHADDLVARTAAAISIEHLGALAWLPDATGRHQIAGPETNIVFSSPHAEMVHVGRALQTEMGLGSNRVMRPYSTDKEGKSPNGREWPGDGEGLWRIAGLPSLQSIAGPTYLLNSNFDCTDYVDVDQMRRQCIAFTNAILRMSRTPREQLTVRRLDDQLWSPPLELINELLL